MILSSLLSFGRPRVKPNLGRLTMQRSAIAIERLARFRLFSSADYRAWHEDIGAMPSARHFVGYGADERRKVATPVHIARTLGELVNSPPAAIGSVRPVLDPGTLTVGVYVSSLGNIHIREIAAGLAGLLKSAGHDVVEGDENCDIDARPGHSIFVAPHEFFQLGRGGEWIRDDVLATACMYCTAPATAMSFWECLPIVLMAKSAVDMSLPLATLFSEVMPAAYVLPSVSKTPRPIDPDLLDHPLLRAQRWWTRELGVGGDGKRPLDVCFFGTASPHRARFFARNAKRLGRYESLIYLRTRNASEKMNAATGEADLIGVARHVARHARVQLNVHRDEFPYFKWHRSVYQGMANRSVVVSEPCFASPPFEPGVHYLAEEQHRLMQLVEWILNDRDGQEKATSVAEAAFMAVHDPDDQAARGRALVAALTA